MTEMGHTLIRCMQEIPDPPPIQPKKPVNTAENVNVLRHIGTKLLRQKKLPSGNRQAKGKIYIVTNQT